MSTTPRAPISPRRTCRALTALALLAATAALSGCMADPRPKPLAIATPVTTASLASPSPSPSVAPPVPSTPSAPLVTRTPPTVHAKPPRPPRISAVEVRAALGRAGIPALRVITQPSPRTRLAAQTVLYTHATTYSGSVTIHRVRIRITATPVRYTWHFGDGTSRSTSTPGAPYPHHTLTHVYRRTGTVHPSVATDYVVTYRVPGGSWTRLSATYLVPGPATALTVVRNP